MIVLTCIVPGWVVASTNRLKALYGGHAMQAGRAVGLLALLVGFAAADRVVQPAGGSLQVTSTLFQPNVLEAVGAVAVC